jgi:hypothetical protein
MAASGSTTNELSVMTLNVYFGCEFEHLFEATELPQIVDSVARMWSDVQASDIPARARSLAREIAAVKPDLVTLSEIAQWSAGSPGAMDVKFDYLGLLLDALRSEGSFYTPIAILKDLDQVGPLDTNGNFLRFEDRDAVLLRVDPRNPVRPYDIRSGTFSRLFTFQNPFTGTLSVPRGWITVDAMIGDAKLHYVASHVESIDFDIQLAQVRELIGGPLVSGLPTILAGDFNSNANQDPAIKDYSPSYPELINAGFVDSWSTVNPGDLGNTCCQAADLRNPASSLDRRLDLILTRGALTPIDARVVAENPQVRTPSGVWPTDHAGVVARFRIG